VLGLLVAWWLAVCGAYRQHALYVQPKAAGFGGVDQQWVRWKKWPRHGTVCGAAERREFFCNHWGFDLLRSSALIPKGRTWRFYPVARRSKNVYPGGTWRTWLRKALEAGITRWFETVWNGNDASSRSI